ncbi:MAG: hypothetical protein ACXVQY_06455 [Actinomycetota bacterium]
MATPAKILLTGGVAAVTVSLLIGLYLGLLRQRQPLDQVHSWLTAHQTVLFQGFMMLGLSLAAAISRLGPSLLKLAAWLIVSAATLSTVATITNAVQGVQDQFAQRSLGLRLNTLQATLVLPGVVILLIGVLRAL